MKSRSGGLGALVAVCVGAICAVSAPAASAQTCSNLSGSGSSLQNIAQNSVWLPEYATFLLSGMCTGMAKLQYLSTSSGTALKEWGDEGALGSESPFPAYIGSDVAPEGPATKGGTQLHEIDLTTEKEVGVLNAVTAVPVAQSAISVIVSLPEGCTPSATPVEITDANLQSEWFEDSTSFATLTGVSGSACNVDPLLEARLKSSGTTAGFKRFLDDITPANWNTFTSSPAKAENNEWPSGTKPDESTNGTGGELAKTVLETPGTVGYADLADAVAKGFTLTPTEHTVGTKKFWSYFAKLENNGEFFSPAEAVTPITEAGSNCAKAEYAAPSKVAPNEDWSNAKQTNLNKSGAKVYPDCTLTFDAGFLHYGYGGLATKYSSSGGFYEGAEKVALGIGLFFHWLVKTGEGQSASLLKKQYAALPAPIQSKAEEITTHEYFKE
jgi:ABC-type phosphate transport system substrate-binding protein